jgi:hypothetical protein
MKNPGLKLDGGIALSDIANSINELKEQLSQQDWMLEKILEAFYKEEPWRNNAGNRKEGS